MNDDLKLFLAEVEVEVFCMSERAFEIYQRVVSDFNSSLRENLTGEDDETIDYVQSMILDEYRPWHWKE